MVKPCNWMRSFRSLSPVNKRPNVWTSGVLQHFRDLVGEEKSAKEIEKE